MPPAQIPRGKTQITIQSKTDMKAKRRRRCRGGGGGEARETPNLVLEVIVNEECARFLNAQGDAVQANTFEESRIRARSLKLELSCAHCESSGSRLRRRLILGLHRDSRHLFPFSLSLPPSANDATRAPFPLLPDNVCSLACKRGEDGTGQREKPESRQKGDSRVSLEPRTRTCIHGFAALPPYILWIGPQGWLRALTCSIHGFAALPLYIFGWGRRLDSEKNREDPDLLPDKRWIQMMDGQMCSIDNFTKAWFSFHIIALSYLFLIFFWGFFWGYNEPI
jgi:hypothetical protein